MNAQKTFCCFSAGAVYEGEGRILQLPGMVRAAKASGFSVRHFRRIAKEQQIRIIQIGRKSFILTSDLMQWARNSNIAIDDEEVWTVSRLK